MPLRFFVTAGRHKRSIEPTNERPRLTEIGLGLSRRKERNPVIATCRKESAKKEERFQVQYRTRTRTNTQRRITLPVLVQDNIVLRFVLESDMPGRILEYVECVRLGVFLRVVATKARRDSTNLIECTIEV